MNSNKKNNNWNNDDNDNNNSNKNDRPRKNCITTTTETRSSNINSNKKSNNSNNNNNDKNTSNNTERPQKNATTTNTTGNDICQKIRNCKTLMELLHLLQGESINMKPSHLSYYWNQISRIISITPAGGKSSMSPCLQRLKRHPVLLKHLVGQTIRHASALDSRSLAVTAHALAKISYKMRKSVVDSEKLWELLERNIIQKANSPKGNFSVQECANIVWSFAKKFGGRSKTTTTSHSTYNISMLFDAMLNELSPKLRQCNAQDIANTVWAYATVDHPATALFDGMMSTAIRKLDKFDSQNLANTVWAYATVKYPAPQLFDAVSEAALTATTSMSSANNSSDSNTGNKLDTFNSQAIANTVWAFASMGHYTPSSKLFLDALAKSAIKKLGQFNSQEMAITTWGYATLNHPSPKLFDAISYQAIQKLPTFNSQGIANTVWAYATMGHLASELFFAVSQLVIERIEMFNSQAVITNTAANCGGGYPMGNLPPEFLNAASSMASFAKVDIFNSQAIANTVWAYATAGHDDRHLFDAMSQLALLNLNNFNSQEIANTMWAYATVKHPSPALFFSIAQSSLPKLGTFNSQELANTLWAFASLNHPAPEFFDTVSNLAVPKLHTFNSQELANTIWAYATVYHCGINPQFTNGILWEAIQKLESLESEQIVNILWSVVVLNSIDTESVVPLFSEISKRYYSSQDNFQLTCEALSQLHQASMWYSEEHQCNESLLPIQLREECFTNFSKNQNIPSKLQRDIVESFKSMPPYLGISVIEEESRCERTGYSIDVLISIQQQQLAVEIDGPCHFVGYTPNGATMLKQRQLCSLGTKPLLSIPYWEWDMLCLNHNNNNTNAAINNIMNCNNWNSTGCHNDHYHYNNNNDLQLKQCYLQQRLQQASFL